MKKINIVAKKKYSNDILRTQKCYFQGTLFDDDGAYPCQSRRQCNHIGKIITTNDIRISNKAGACRLIIHLCHTNVPVLHLEKHMEPISRQRYEFNDIT